MYRVRKKISQKDLAEKSGVSLHTIQAIECGARSAHQLNLETAYRLALVLDVSPQYFLDRDTIVFPDGRNGLEFEEDEKDRKKELAKIKEEAKEKRRKK